MSLRSLELLARLQSVPTDHEVAETADKVWLNRLRGMDRDQWSIEFSAGVEKAMIALFDARNIPDDISEAHRLLHPSQASAHEHYLEIVARGEDSVRGFVSSLKGKVAELRVVPQLEKRFPDYRFALEPNPNHPVSDIYGIGPEGAEKLLIQVKVGADSYTSEVLQHMEEAPENVMFMVGQEIYEKISASRPELAGRLIDSGISGQDLTEDVSRGLELLARNHGIDVPDSLEEILPYVGEVVLGVKLVMQIVAVERGFSEAEISDRARVHGLKALTLMSRFGITAVCVGLGGAAGSIATPGVGTVAGSLGGAGLATYLNRRMKPRMLQVALNIANMTEDDLFYLRNKGAVDRIGSSMATTAVA